MTIDSPIATTLQQEGIPLSTIQAEEGVLGLVPRLCNEVAGVHKLECSEDELRALAGKAGYVVFEANLKGIRGRQNLLTVLSQAAAFPPEFGVNWDAFADALCDLSWHGKVSGYVLLLHNASDTLGLSAHDKEIADDLFADTVVYWRQRKKSFWVFLS